jgi:hypothetical protein
VDRGAVGEFWAGSADDLFEIGLSAVVFVYLESFESSLIVLHSLCKTGVVG